MIIFNESYDFALKHYFKMFYIWKPDFRLPQFYWLMPILVSSHSFGCLCFLSLQFLGEIIFLYISFL